MENKKLSLRILRLVLAEQAILEADAMAEHISSTRIDPNSPLYFAAVAGMSASYWRPFTENNGLGSLIELKEFPPDKLEMKNLHEKLAEQRNTLGCHFDRNHLKTQFQRGILQLNPGEVEITFLEKSFKTRTNHTTTSPDAVKDLRQLFQYQLVRLRGVLGGICGEIARERGEGSIVFSP